MAKRAPNSEESSVASLPGAPPVALNKSGWRATVLVPIMAGMFGALIGALLSTYLAHSYKIKEQKLDTLRRIAANRFTIVETATGRDSHDFFAALNEAVIVFHDSPAVISALAKLQKEGQGKENDNFVNLFKAMFADMGIEYDSLNDSFFTHPLTINPTRFPDARAQ